MRSTRKETEDVTQTQFAAGSVKWFDNSKGFGFIICTKFDSDVLLHQTTLVKSNLETVVEGSYIEFLYQMSKMGRRVSEVLSIENTKSSDKKIRTNDQLEICPKAMPARVKWYDMERGFGFVNCFSMPEDIFIGARVIKSAGFTAVSAGQALSVRIVITTSGKRVYQICNWLTE